MLSSTQSKHHWNCLPQRCGCCHRCCSEDLWDGGIRWRLCVIVPRSLRLQQYSTATDFISMPRWSLHRLVICRSPGRSLGSIALPWPCFASRTNKPFWGTVEGGRTQVSWWFLAVILRAGTRAGGRSGQWKWAPCLCLSDLIWIKPSPESAALWSPRVPAHHPICLPVCGAGLGD